MRALLSRSPRLPRGSGKGVSDDRLESLLVQVDAGSQVAPSPGADAADQHGQELHSPSDTLSAQVRPLPRPRSPRNHKWES